MSNVKKIKKIPPSPSGDQDDGHRPDTGPTCRSCRNGNCPACQTPDCCCGHDGSKPEVRPLTPGERLAYALGQHPHKVLPRDTPCEPAGTRPRDPHPAEVAFGARLREARQGRGLDPLDLVGPAGVPLAEICRAERGGGVSLGAAVGLAVALGRPLSELLEPARGEA